MSVVSSEKIEQMSEVTSEKIEQIPSKENPNDVYSVFENSLTMYCNEVRANAASYLQAVSDLQEEIIELRKKNADSAISLQKTAFEELGVNTTIPDATYNLAKLFGEQTTKSWTIQNQIILKSLDTLSKNIEAFNTNSKSFEDINKQLIDSWTSIIYKTVKD